jgi:hypothetical protein
MISVGLQVFLVGIQLTLCKPHIFLEGFQANTPYTTSQLDSSMQKCMEHRERILLRCRLSQSLRIYARLAMSRQRSCTQMDSKPSGVV